MLRFWVRVGFRLLAATDDDGELLMLVETTASVVGCSGCGTRARSKGSRRTKVRDLPTGGRPVVLVWSKRVWRCREAACEVGSWSETSPHIRPRAVLTQRARREAARRVGEDGASVAAVGVVALDPWRGYLGPARELVPEATVTVDRFHMIRIAKEVVTEVRQRTQQEVTGHRGRKGDPLYDIRRLLLVGRERLHGSQERRVEAALAHEHADPYDGVACAWWAKEHLRDGYAAGGHPEAREALEAFHAWATEVDVPEVDRLSHTLRTWEEETPQLSPHRCYQRTHRSRQHDHRKNPPSRTRIP